MAATNHAQNIKKDTIECITTAMLRLLLKQKLSSLTVSQVCKRAGVSRMAFYRNFDSLEQVLYEYYRPKISKVFEAVQKTDQDDIKFEVQLNFFNTFGDVFLLSIKHEYEPIIMRIFIDEIEKFFETMGDDYWVSFMSAGVYALWRKWLIEGKQKPLNEIMEFLKKFDSIR